MKIPEGRELAFQMLVSLFVAVVCLVAALIVLRSAGTTAALFGIGAFLVSLFYFGIRVSANSPGDKNRTR